MAKIQTYSLATTPLSLDDMLIGTDIINPIPNATKNFTLGQLLNLFLPYIPSNTLQAVLNAGNTATQNIILTGTITATVIKPINITDINSSNGSTGQVLSKQFSGVVWTTINGLPSQIGQSGRFLTTNGNIASWAVIPASSTTASVTADLTVGAINAGDVIASGTTLQVFVQKLITKVYNPSYVDPYFGLNSNASTVEVGTTVSFTLSFYFDRGGIYGSTSGTWNPSFYQGSRAGASTSYTINGVTQVSNSLLVSGYVVALGINQFIGTVDYSVGQQPYNSKGGTTGLTPLAADTSPTQSTYFEGIYPYYWYKSNSAITAASMKVAIESGAAAKVVNFSTGTITINYAAAGEYLAVAYPATSTTKTIWYVNALDNGTIPGGVFGAATILPCSADNGLTPIWSNVDYKIHVTAGLITQSNPIELRNN